MSLRIIAFTLVFWPVLAALGLPDGAGSSAALRVPAFTAYIEPDAEALPVSEQDGITGWTDPREQVVWYGRLNSIGRLDISVSLRLPETSLTKLRLSVAEQAPGLMESKKLSRNWEAHIAQKVQRTKGILCQEPEELFTERR